MKLADAIQKYDFFYVLFKVDDQITPAEIFVPSDEIEEFIKDNFVLKICGTEREDFSLDGESIVENACYDSYADCFDDILNGGGMKVLQEFLDEWCEKYGLPSYYADLKTVIEF